MNENITISKKLATQITRLLIQRSFESRYFPCSSYVNMSIIHVLTLCVQQHVFTELHGAYIASALRSPDRERTTRSHMRFSGFQCPGNEWIARVWLFFRHAQMIAPTRLGYAHNCEIMRGWRVPFHCRLNSGLPGVPGTTPRDNALRRITEFNEAGPPLRDAVFPRRDSVSDSKRSLQGGDP